VDQWPGGFVANLTVTAGGSALSGWRVAIALPSGSAYSNGWSAVFSGSGSSLQAGNASYNGSLGAGQSTSFGFQGTGTASGLTLSCTPA
jgi:cellulase/cellobiase CelA1